MRDSRSAERTHEFEARLAIEASETLRDAPLEERFRAALSFLGKKRRHVMA